MLDFLQSLPKTILVAICLIGGVLFIVLIYDPPKVVCDAQLETFKLSVVGLLTPNPKQKSEKEGQLRRLYDNCLATGTPGGCYELFFSIRKLLLEIETVSRECLPKLGRLSEVQMALIPNLELMVQIAWGSKPPQTPQQVAGWLDPSDINLFCRLKQKIEDIYGIAQVEALREKYMSSLPGANTMSRPEVWPRMLMSVNCSKFL